MPGMVLNAFGEVRRKNEERLILGLGWGDALERGEV